MSVLVVISAYNSTQLTIDCLHSLEKEVATVDDLKVGICDNGNTDDTYERLTQAIKNNNWGDWVYVRRVMPNRGFSGGNNVILREALNSDNCPDFFLLLNADTIVRPNAIKSLLESADKEPEVGIFSPRMECMDGSTQISFFRQHSPISQLIRAAGTGAITKLLKKWDVPMEPSDDSSQAEWLCFACALIRKEVMYDIGVLDEGYYLYYDDADYCYSAMKSGWKIKYVPDSTVVHFGGQSTTNNDVAAELKRLPAYCYRSRSWYLTKFYGKSGLLMANLCWIVGRVISKLREILGNKNPHLCEKEWRDNWIGFFTRVEPKVNIKE